MTGADSIKHTRRNGQAMVEFLVGLVGILFLILGLYQIVIIVDEDFDSLIGSRQEVAEALVRGSGGSSPGGGSDAYRPGGDFYGQLLGNIRYYDEYADAIASQAYPDDGFAPLTGNPLSDLVGVSGGADIAVDSAMMRKVIGSNIQINNQVWMPRWTDLMQ